MTDKKDIQAGTVALGYCHGLEVAAGFANSLASLLIYELTGPDQRLRQFLPTYAGVNVSNGRNDIVRAFLAGDCEWLWMVDSDMTFVRDTLAKLMSVADPTRTPVVGGLAFGVNDGKLFPTLYDILPHPETGKPGTVRYDSYPRNRLMPVVATGAACLLIHRSALEAMAEAGYNRTFPWFQETEFNGAPCGEDMTFCFRLAKLGIPVHVHTGIPVGHQKAYVLSEAMYREQRAAEGLQADVDPDAVKEDDRDVDTDAAVDDGR